MKHSSLPPLLKSVLYLAGILVLLLAGALGYRFLAAEPVSTLPTDIREQMEFSPFVISSTSSDYTASNYEYFPTEDGSRSLYFQVTAASGEKIGVTQSVQPQAFNEIPDYKTQFLTNTVQQSTTAQTSNGPIYVGQGVKENNFQIAVMLERGLIVLMRPIDSSQEFDGATWRRLGEAFELEKL